MFGGMAKFAASRAGAVGFSFGRNLASIEKALT